MFRQGETCVIGEAWPSARLLLGSSRIACIYSGNDLNSADDLTVRQVLGGRLQWLSLTHPWRYSHMLELTPARGHPTSPISSIASRTRRFSALG